MLMTSFLSVQIYYICLLFIQVSLETSTSRNGGGYFFMKSNILPGCILMDNVAPG